eukprot:5963360-Heterocapsa_arctica.AAC.1
MRCGASAAGNPKCERGSASAATNCSGQEWQICRGTRKLEMWLSGSSAATVREHLCCAPRLSPQPPGRRECLGRP